MREALFFRKCYNLNELKHLSGNLSSYGQILKYNVISTIQLNNFEYNNFINNFLFDNDHIKHNKDNLTMDDFDCVNCILFTNNMIEGILVYPAGYNYARYVAIWKGK